MSKDQSVVLESRKSQQGSKVDFMKAKGAEKDVSAHE